MGKKYICEKCKGVVNDSDLYCVDCGSKFDTAFRSLSYDKSKGHITAVERAAILAMFNQNVTEGKIGKKNYKIEKEGDWFVVSIQEMTRGMIPVPGSPLRSTVRKVYVKVK
jgi:hypothetical protein